MLSQLISLSLLLLLSPVFLLIGIGICLSNGLPIFYFQERIGKDGVSFWIIKFRTMKLGADGKKKELYKSNEADGPVFKMRDDPRFTRFGKILSHTGLDELPQLLNVLKGDMTFIGPRPLPVVEAKRLKPWMKTRERVLPGLISPAIVTGNYHEDFEAWMNSDIYYVERKTLGTDIALLFPIGAFLVKLVLDELKLALKKGKR